jgi:AbrB family looped-hinge helix DNA binding protein
MEKLISKKFLTLVMDAKIVTVTSKGQISLPIAFRKELDIDSGDGLLLVKSGKSLMIEKIDESKFNDLRKHSKKVALKLWGNKEDEIWDKAR